MEKLITAQIYANLKVYTFDFTRLTRTTLDSETRE